MEQPSGNAPTPATATEAITGSVEREAITPEQFMAEMEAQGLAGPKITDDTAGVGEKPAGDGEAATPEGETTETPAAEAKTDGEAATDGAAKPEDETPPEAKPTDSEEVRRARKIFTAAAKKEAAALRIAQENKALKGQVESLVKLRDEDPLGLLQALGFGKGAEPDAVKDLLGRIVSKGEKPTPSIEEKFEALKKQLDDERATAARTTEEATVAQLKSAVAARVKQEGAKFDLVNSLDAHDEVCEVMEQYHAAHGVPLDPLVAAQEVEDFYAAKLSRSTKFKAPPAAPAAQAAKPATTSNGNKPTSNVAGKSETLTNADSGRTTDPADDFPMDDHDARAKAVAKSLNMGFVRN